MPFEERRFCVLCAWRELCLKKYSYGGGPALNCPDFVRDLTIKEEGQRKEVRPENERDSS